MKFLKFLFLFAVTLAFLLTHSMEAQAQAQSNQARFSPQVRSAMKKKQKVVVSPLSQRRNTTGPTTPRTNKERNNAEEGVFFSFPDDESLDPIRTMILELDKSNSLKNEDLDLKRSNSIEYSDIDDVMKKVKRILNASYNEYSEDSKKSGYELVFFPGHTNLLPDGLILTMKLDFPQTAGTRDIPLNLIAIKKKKDKFYLWNLDGE